MNIPSTKIQESLSLKVKKYSNKSKKFKQEDVERINKTM